LTHVAKLTHKYELTKFCEAGVLIHVFYEIAVIWRLIFR